MSFQEKFRLMDLDVIEEINSKTKNFELNNVLEGFERNYYSIGLGSEESLEEYMLMFVGNHNSCIKGFTLKNARSLDERDLNTFRFSKEIELHYPNLNSLVVFNTFQNCTKSVFENYGIVCLPEHITNGKNSISLMLSCKNGVDSLLKIDIGKFYQSFFPATKTRPNKKGVQKIYLIYDYRADKIKVGETRDKLENRLKGISEPTLRAEQPFMHIIAAWEAPKLIENELQLKYKYKRVRGEWFDLRPTDLKDIKQLLSKYQMIEF